MNNILHIDNSDFFRKAMEVIFVNNGYNYFGAKNFLDAKLIIENQKIDIICSGTEASGNSIFDFLGYLNNSIYNQIPVIVITSNESSYEKERLFSYGIIDYITKDEDPYTIIKYINNLTKPDIVLEKSKALNIVVIDDSELVLEIIRSIFNSIDIKNVSYFKNCDNVIENFEKYDCFIVDMVLENMSGKAIISKIREKSENVVVISISSIDSYKTISYILAEGADDFIAKPFNREIFIARFRSNIRSYIYFKELKEKTFMLEQAVIRDSLTRLYNRQYIMDRLEEELKKYLRFGTIFSVAMLDIDFFKNINDTLGHQAGDEVLKRIADTIVKSLREIDIVGRYGGEEFIIIMPSTEKDKAVIACERIRSDIENLKLEEYSELRLTISAGVVQYTADETILSAISRADTLLYRAKHNGRNRVEK